MNTPVYKWEYLHSQIFSAFVSALNKAGVRYFILRNYEGLPDENVSKDVDIIVDSKKYETAKKILLDCFMQFDISHYYIMDYERAHCIYGIDTKKCFAIHIDLIAGYANKGFEILDFNILYSNTNKYKDFRVLNSSYDIVMLILYKVIGCKELKERYREKIRQVYKEEKKNIDKVLKSILDNLCADSLINDLNQDNFESIVRYSKTIGNSAKQRVFFKHPLKTIYGILYFCGQKSYNMIWCPRKKQKIIAVEAPDGTGKTTFIDNLVVKLSEYFVADISKCKIYHHRPNILPNMGAVGEKVGIMKQDKNFTMPHRAKPAGKISSFLRMVYYWIDYVIGVPLILRKNAQFDKITIFDRYIYDFLVDPYRTRIKLPYWIRKTFSRLVKQPRIVFVLNADADTIFARKQELSKEEIERQLIEFRRLSNLGKRVHFLDATQTPEEIAQDAIKIVIDEFTKRI